MKLFKQIVYEFSRKPFLHDNFERLFLSTEPKNLFTANFLRNAYMKNMDFNHTV